MTNIIEHGWWMVGHRSNLVHFPGIFVELDPRFLGNSFALVDQFVEQVSQA